ncbi:MAG: alpha-L-fucosidase [Bacteroidetes bacterium]|nr:MAG: alpha-L-fucosidase [Bacteroidota bacterium]
MMASCATPSQGEEKTPPTDFLQESEADRAARMEWWKEARFGMFIHWGLYAVPAGEYKGERVKGIGEWIMHRQHIPIAEYEKFASQFNPTAYDAKAWVQLAKAAGMKYIVITSKHHDGFALWDSKVTDWDVVDRTPYGKDLLKPLAEACAEEGIKLCFYYSIMDWHHPDAQADTEPNYNRGRNDTHANPNFPRYLEDYMKPQLEELLTNYGDIGVLWFDGEWVPDYTTEMGKEVYTFVRSLQPDIIINNRVDKGRKGMEGLDAEGDFAGDFGTPEQEIPATGVPGVDWESCMTMNDTWGYKSFDDNWKSDTTLIRNLVDIVSKGGNFLLNIGPTAEGRIPEASVTRLQAMGAWMDVNSEAIYGAQASPFERPDWGRFTQKGDILYAHIFDWPAGGELVIPELSEAQSARILGGEAVDLSSGAGGTTLHLPAEAPDGIATVVAINR